MTNRLLLILAVCVFFFSGPASARMGDLGNMKVEGFLSAGYYNSVTTERASFLMEQAELDFFHDTTYAGFRVDLNFTSEGGAEVDDYVEQGYAWVDLGERARLDMGKFNAPIGFESVDPVDMYQISHALVYSYGLPSNLTGVKFYADLGTFDVTAYVVNGWDNIIDDNKDKTYGARIGMGLIPGYSLGLSVITGNEGIEEVTNRLSVVDVDFTAQPLDSLTIGVEINYGMFDKQSALETGSDATWMAALFMLSVKLNPVLAITGRYDYFSDNDGARLGAGKKESRHALTACIDYNAEKNLRLMGELRFVMSSEKVFAKAADDLQDKEFTLAAQALYSF